jgi:ABC-2 type transport system permease protein
MTLNGVRTLWELELVRMSQAPVSVAATLATPLAWLVLFGASAQAGFAPRVGGGSYLAFMAPGVAVLLAVFFALASGARTMADKSAGFLKEVLVAPVGRMEIVLGRTAGICTIVLVQAGILLGIAALMGAAPPLPYGILSVAGVVGALCLIALGFTGVGLGIAAGSGNPQSYQSLIGLATLPMFFLSGAIVPIASLPAWAQALAMVNPMAYAVDAARQAAIGAQVGAFPLALDILGLAGFALATLSVGAKRLAA